MTRIAWAAAALLALALAVQSWRIYQAEHAAIAAAAARQRAELAASGWKDAAEASQRELASTVPQLREQLDAARRANAELLLTHRTTTAPEAFLVPFDCPGATSSPGAGAGEPAAPHGAPQPTGIPVAVTVDSQTAVVALADGSIEWSGRLFATLSSGEWHETRELTPLHDTLAADSDLGRAWAAWRNRPPRVAIGFRPVSQWRAGWVAGAGLSYDPFAQRLAPAVFVGWGISF